jgi:hypothetical protein
VKGNSYTYTLTELARIFVDYDRIESRAWDAKYGTKIWVLVQHFDMPPGSTVIDTLREAMAVVLHTGKPLTIHPGQARTEED